MHRNNRDTLGAVAMAIALLATALLLQGCCLFGTTRTVYTPLPTIPVGEPPPLSGDQASDFPIIASDALRSRRLIMRYNEIAKKVNAEHGAEDTTLDSIDLNTASQPTE